jgi:hypothetical protein
MMETPDAELLARFLIAEAAQLILDTGHEG